MLSPSLWKFALVAASCLRLADALLPDGRPHGNIAPMAGVPRVAAPSEEPVVSRNGTVLPPYDFVYYFDQLIDHNPSLGTFKQRYWHTYEYYKPGGPIILNTPGEGNADGYSGYLTNLTVNGVLANQQNGATIVIEHRFYGLSNPYPDLSVKSLQVHTLQQGIDDLVYFAKNVKLPQPDGDNVGPDKNPWILIGGSYSGALVAWIQVNKPGVFFAAYSSSGVVEAITDFWRYFEPIRQRMPQNCSADVQAVLRRVDSVFTSGDDDAIAKLQDTLGLTGIEHLDDAAGALRNNLWDWQSLSPSAGNATAFFKFCDALEVKDGVSAPATGWGVDHALAAWGAYLNAGYWDNLCGNQTKESCFGTYNGNTTFYTSIEVDNSWRSWFWIVCNQVGFLQDTAPAGTPSLVSRLVKIQADKSQCALMFPDAFPKGFAPMEPGVQATNRKFGGWNLKEDRLLFANGHRDPWREATTSAETQNIKSTSRQPILIGDGFHCSDLRIKNNVDPTVAAVQTKVLAIFQEWLKEWKVPVHHRREEEQTTKREDTVVPLKAVNAWFRFE